MQTDRRLPALNLPPQDPAGLPVRLVSRTISEVQLMNLHASHRLTSGVFETAIVAHALLRGALPYLDWTDGPALPSGTPLIGSINGVARSFERSPETIRRHVQALAAEGYFTVERGGVRLTPTTEAAARIVAYIRAIHDNLLWLIAQLDDWGLITRPASARLPVPMAEPVTRMAFDMRLQTFEKFRGPLSGWTSMQVWNTLSVASVRHIVISRRLSSLFVQRSTPDALRRPLSLRALCTLSGLPYATVRRHLIALESHGKVGRKGQGFSVLTEQLLVPEFEARVVNQVRDALGRLQGLVTRGLDPARIPNLYLGQAPSIIPLPAGQGSAMPGAAASKVA